MEQKVAIVTGGSSGIGYATAKKFTANNIFTYVIARDKEKLEQACLDFGKNCEPVVFDLTQRRAMPELVKGLVSMRGRIDILVNNAGINLKKNFADVTDDEFDRVIQTNLSSIFSLSREVSQQMLLQQRGCIINISSMAAQYGLPGVIAYTASKTAIEGMTRAMAVELSPRGIRVNCIAPGFILTKMSSTALDSDPERKTRVMSRTPLARLGMPEDIANMALYLASEEAAFVTGTVIPVDGGNSIGF